MGKVCSTYTHTQTLAHTQIPNSQTRNSPLPSSPLPPPFPSSLPPRKDKVTMGSDYPFPLGECFPATNIYPGRLIRQVYDDDEEVSREGKRGDFSFFLSFLYCSFCSFLLLSGCLAKFQCCPIDHCPSFVANIFYFFFFLDQKETPWVECS